MSSPGGPLHDDLLRHLERTTPLPRAQLDRVVGDVLQELGETVEEYVRRRHRELRDEGHQNEAIFAQVADEIGRRRFRAPELSPRQLRRMVYG